MKFHEISIFLHLFVYKVALAADFGYSTCSDPTFRAKVSLSNLQLTVHKQRLCKQLAAAAA